MRFAVQLTDDAARDLEEISDHLSRQGVPGRAKHVLDRIEEAFLALSAFPGRDSYPSELRELGIREYREVFFKPDRIIYRVMEDSVCVLVIADGRRDMRALLEQRLMHA